MLADLVGCLGGGCGLAVASLETKRVALCLETTTGVSPSLGLSMSSSVSSRVAGTCCWPSIRTYFASSSSFSLSSFVSHQTQSSEQSIGQQQRQQQVEINETLCSTSTGLCVALCKLTCLQVTPKVAPKVTPKVTCFSVAACVGSQPHSMDVYSHRCSPVTKRLDS